ncbi:MAG TPA: ABC transporter permease, partial [Gammaproteobacteria bacterium]|nr:ABC transporter permease [Gammaproteobacteria bacterium]
QTESEVAETQTFIREFGNITLITLIVGAAVFFSMLLVTVNTTAQSVRERTAELATLNALGFTRTTVSSLVLCEAIGITVIGGGLGLLAAWGLTHTLAEAVQDILPAFTLPLVAVGLGVGLMALFGLFSGGLPLGHIFRLQAADALRRN